MKRRRAIGFGCIHIYVFLEQSAYGIPVARPGRVGKRRSTLGAGAHKEYAESGQDQALPSGCHPHHCAFPY
jgi:hypothetical protein